MKLICLKVGERFRSLQAGFEITFHDTELDEESFPEFSAFHPFCLTGLNGSGKSNVLEALASIFFHLDSCALKYKPELFEKAFNPNVCSPNIFELQYYISQKGIDNPLPSDMYKVKITKAPNQGPKMWVTPFPFISDDDTIQIPTFASNRQIASSKNYLPDLIIAYSSGENEILSLPFIKSKFLHYDEYVEYLRNGYEYNEPESSLIYIDNSMSQAVLLSNLLFQDDLTLKPIRDELGILSMRSFRMNINLHKAEQSDKLITEQLNEKINRLKLCATCWFNEDSHQLTLDFYLDSVTKQAFRKHFKNTFELFRLFQVLYFLNNRTISNSIKNEVYRSSGFYTDGKIPHPSPADHVFYFLDFLIEKVNRGEKESKDLLLRNFSDGEHQFLHTMGICLMLRNRRSLLLLDEPETHFNPDWRSKFIKILRDSIAAGGGSNILKEIIMTSHSPFIISDCLPDKVISFKKVEGAVEAVDARHLNLNTYGTSVDTIVDILFGKSQTIGELSLSELQFDISKVKTKAQVSEIKNKIKNLGSSFEKDLLLASLNSLEIK